MSKFRKLCAVILAIMMLISCFGTTILSVAAEETTTEETTPVSITGSALDFLYNQAVELDAAYAEANGKTSPTKEDCLGSQTGPWFVSTSRSTSGHKWADAYYLWYLKSSEIRYGSNWTYWAPSVGFFGTGESRTLRAWLRNLSSESSDVYNDYVKLYYVAETSGVYKIAPDEFVVNSSDAEGYQAYITIKANGEEIFKSRALQRKNRVVAFEGAEVTLSAGDKIEWIFDYVVTDENGVYNGNMTFNFDPQLELLETVELEGTGEVADVIYDAMEGLAASGTNKSVATTQTAVWREQLYRDGKWSDLGYYCNHSKSYTGSLDWAYNDSSYSQTDSMNLRYKGSSIGNGLILCARIPMTRWNMKQMRLVYTAELDGRYTLTDRLGYFEVNTGALTVYDYWVQITHNGTVLWKSDILANKGEKAVFDGVTLDMTKGDTLAIEFKYNKKSGATASYDTTRMDVEFAPVLSYKAIEPEVPYKASDAYNELFAGWEMAEGDTALSGTLVQPETGWTFEKGFDISSLESFANYYYSGGDIYWGNKILGLSSGYNGGAYPGIFINIGLGNGVSPARGKMYVRYRGCTQTGGIQSTHDYAKDFAYSFIAPKEGTYLLSETVASLDVDTSAISDTIVKIYKNSSLIYQSDILNYANQSVTVPEATFRLKAKDKVIIYFERQLDASVYDWNNNIRVVCDPTITYIPSSADDVEINGYTPVQSERYYAKNITAPVAFSAWVNTDDILAGNIFSSDKLSVSVNNDGYPVVSYGDKEIVFTFDIRGKSWTHIAVSYNAEAGSWTLYYNGLSAATVTDADYTATDIEKLYIGASEDTYNNYYFKGSVAQLAFFDSALSADAADEIFNAGVTADDAVAYFELSDITAETALVKETLAIPAQDRGENGLIFLNQNYRLDLYETFEVPVNTFETWVRLESIFNSNASAGYIASSGQVNDKTNVGASPCAMIEITTGGRPKLTFKDSSGQTNIIFNADIRSDNWVHLAITADYDAGYYYCYFNGELVDKQATNGKQIPATLRPYLVSGNYYNQQTPFYFQGDLAGLTMFSDARTAEEIYNDIYGVDLKDSNLLGSWNLEGDGNILNRNGDGNDLHPFWADTPAVTVDESFGNYSTIVFIPDTQNDTTSASHISKWIVENKDKENIVGVMGLGDITNNNNSTQWSAVKTGFEPLKGVVPYVFTSGNHDIASGRDVTNFNKYFPYADWEPYMDGFFEEGKIDNMYVLTEDVNGNKYMLLSIEYLPRNAVLEWANKVVSEHRDYNVIISTHGYQTYNYETKQNTYLTGKDTALLGEDSNSGKDIWDKFASQHKNVISVVCGHVYHEDIHATTNTGVNGNKVREIIANAQITDVLMKGSSTIMILRISEDGTKANVNYLATQHGKYHKDLNQFNIDWIEGGYVENVLGDIDGDGAVNASDLVPMRLRLLSPGAEYDEAYDINEDGVCNILDLVRLKKLCVTVAKSEGVAVTKGDAVIYEKIDVGQVSEDSDAVVASGTANVVIAGGSYNGGSGASNTAVWAKENAKVTINDGTFTVGADANGDYNDLIYARDNAQVIINGGFFESEVPWSNNGKYYVLNVRNDSSATITVYGGTFVNYNPADGDDVVEGAITVADGYTVISEEQDNGDIWYTVVKN